MNLLVDDVYSYITDRYFETSRYKELMKRLSISIFAENCLSDNVIIDSAKIYEEFGK